MISGSVLKAPYILVITSGKGGVGKSVLSANIAHCLSELGKKVLLWDANRSFPNCHLILGVEPPVRLSEVYNGLVDIEKAVFEISDNLFLLADHPGSGFDNESEKNNFLDVLRDLLFDTDFDIIIIDSPAGFTEISLNVARVANEVNIVITDEPTSLLDGYGLIKLFLRNIEKDKMKLLVNNVIDYDDGKEMSKKLNLATEKFLGFSIEADGFFPYDRIVRQSIVKQELFVSIEPDKEISRAVAKYAQTLADRIESDREELSGNGEFIDINENDISL